MEHPEGLLLVDTGETARVTNPGHLPSWHPYYRRSVRFEVQRSEEIDVRLQELGVRPDLPQTVLWAIAWRTAFRGNS